MSVITDFRLPSVHSYRSARRHAAIQKTNSELLRLQLELAQTRFELQSWKDWWTYWCSGDSSELIDSSGCEDVGKIPDNKVCADITTGAAKSCVCLEQLADKIVIAAEKHCDFVTDAHPDRTASYDQVARGTKSDISDYAARELNSIICIQKHWRGWLCRTNQRSKWCSIAFNTNVLAEGHWAWKHAASSRRGKSLPGHGSVLTWLQIARIYVSEVFCKACGDRGHEAATCRKLQAAYVIQRFWLNYFYKRLYRWTPALQSSTCDCGQQLSDDAKFCGKCGAKKFIPESAMKELASMSQQLAKNFDIDGALSINSEVLQRSVDNNIKSFVGWPPIFLHAVSLFSDGNFWDTCRRHRSMAFDSPGIGILFWHRRLLELHCRRDHRKHARQKASATLMAALICTCCSHKYTKCQLLALRAIIFGSDGPGWLRTSYGKALHWDLI